MNEISMKKSCWCHLEYEGHQIAVHFSIWSGKEIVYVDDHPVSEKRNLLSFTSKHEISIDKVPYIVELTIENPFTYSAEVRLKKRNRTVSKTNQRYVNKNSLKKVLFFILASVGAGFTIGFLLPYLWLSS